MSSAQPGGRPPAGSPGGAHETLLTGDELATTIIMALQRLVQQSTLYTSENEALRRQLEQTAQAVADYAQVTGRNVRITFSERAVYVGRRLLRAGRAVYAVAHELRSVLDRLGATEISIDADVSLDDLRALQGHFRAAVRGESAPSTLDLRRVTLRRGKPPSAHAAFDTLTSEEQAVKLYALAIVVMRRFLEEVQRGKQDIPGVLRQVTRQLVQLSDRAGPTFLRMTTARQVHDDAGRATNATLVALAMARQLTDDPRVLSQIAFACLLYDVGRARAADLAAEGDPRAGMRLPRLNVDQTEALAQASAALLVSLGKMTDAGMAHAVLIHEALVLNHRGLITPQFATGAGPALASRIAACAHRYQALLSDSDIGDTSADVAIATMAQEAQLDRDHEVLQLLMATVGIFPRGTVVELSTGELAEVVAVPVDLDEAALPRVRLLSDDSAQVADGAEEIDLAAPHGGRPPPRIVRVRRRSPGVGPAEPRGGDAATIPIAAARRDGSDRAERTTYRPPAAAASTPAVPVSGRVPQEFDGTEAEIVIPVGPSEPRPSLSGLVSVPPPRPDSQPVEVVEEAPAVDRASRPGRPKPTAQGTLRTTPLTHLLVFALDRQLTGSALLVSPEHTRSAIYFHQGVPAKARTPDLVAPLDRTLVKMGVLDEATLLETRRRIAATGQLHGRLLVEQGLISEATLRLALEQQLVDKIRYMFELPPDTHYGYFEGLDLLASYGGVDLVPCDPLALVMMGVRQREDDPLVQEVVGRLRDVPLELHQASEIERLALHNDERSVVELLRAEPRTLAELVATSGLSPRQVELLVYALVITRSIDLSGGTRDPVGAGTGSRQGDRLR